MTVQALLSRVQSLQRLADKYRKRGAGPAKPQPTDGLYDIIPRLARGYAAPRHLDPLVRDIELSWRAEVRGTYCAPPRHAKTETVLAAIALSIALFPHETNVYATYGSGLARSKARKIRAYAETLGVRWDSGASNLSEMRTPEGGGLLATGVGAGLTGQGANRIFIDDPYKNRIDAESAAYRQMLIDWFGDVAETRVEPGGSVFIFHTRWHVDDLIGHVLTGPDKRWVHRLMPALNDNGEALWPERWPAAALRQKELAVGPYTWASLYQGSPRPRGGTVFVGVAFYHEAPKGYRVAIGVDLAYTAKTQADSSVAVVLAESEGKYYVLEVVRRQVKAPDFKNELLRLAQAYPGASMRIYGAGTEKGAIDLMRGDGVPLVQMPPKGDKFVRAQPAAAAWNSGDILVPAGENNRDVDPDEVLPNGKRRALRDAPAWVNDFVAEVAHFTGVNDKQDDQIDALAAAFDELAGGASTTYDLWVDLPAGF